MNVFSVWMWWDPEKVVKLWPCMLELINHILIFYLLYVCWGLATHTWFDAAKIILMILDPQCLKTIFTYFKVCEWKALGGVISNTFVNGIKWLLRIKMEDFLLGLDPFSKILFVGPLSLHRYPGFHNSRLKYGLGLVVLKVLVAAVEELDQQQQNICINIFWGLD